MKTKKFWWVLVLILFWGSIAVALLGHFFWHKSYSTEKPVNWDRPKYDTVYRDTTTYAINGINFNIEDNQEIQDYHNNRYIYFIVLDPIYNHSELKPLATAN